MDNEDSQRWDKNISEALRQFWVEFDKRLKEGDPKAYQFKEALKRVLEDILRSAHTPTISCEEKVGYALLCKPCPRHQERYDALIIMPTQGEKVVTRGVGYSIEGIKLICAKEPKEPIRDLNTAWGISLANAEVLEEYMFALRRLNHFREPTFEDFEKIRAEITARQCLMRGLPSKAREVYKELFNEEPSRRVLKLITKRIKEMSDDGS
uniref:Uncharacterized protein n=1 Tax=Los Azufres archaeal virus 2 TaxID=1425359 RepID=A0A0A0PA21_9VIRU|nr:hypothetical protein [Los Azufres archaeal virus 2]